MVKSNTLISLLTLSLLLVFISNLASGGYDGEKQGNGDATVKFNLGEITHSSINVSSKNLVVGDKLDSKLKFELEHMGESDEMPVIILLDNAGKSDKIRQEAVAATLKQTPEHKYNLVNAIAGRVSKGELISLSGNPDVVRVFYDHQVYALPMIKNDGAINISLSTSTDAIGADYVRDVLGYTGSGVTVAVIDTGIDYTHPDLGGCFGAGCRVKGGYDFVNVDSDPVDDNSHGTHCAGIIGANGGLVGVAPGVEFLAVKVLDSGGSGYLSDIAAGVDWAVGNGADVISMSLGGQGQPNSPNDGKTALDIIVDAAVDHGVVVVVAAGNEGPGTGIVGTPAESENVISVGASDDKNTFTVSDDTVADFSCRGPSAFGRFDPEVVAPGVDINSTVLSGGYDVYSGTSMATPHVAGAAALILDYNPNLTPTFIRAMLMHSAGNITGHVFEKGAGIINVTKAITYTINASILGKSDRWEDLVFPGFCSKAQVRVDNNGGSPVTVTFGVESLTNLEGDSSIPTSQFALPGATAVGAGSSTTVDVIFCAPESAGASIYGSTLLVSDGSQTLRIPISFSIPLTGAGTITGSADNAASDGTYDEGDRLYYPLKTTNGTSISVTLNWTSSSNDLDLYLYNPAGVLLNYSQASVGTSESVSLSEPYYETLWAAVNAWSISGSTPHTPVPFTLTADYNSQLKVSPQSWNKTMVWGETANITFYIKNNDASKPALNFDVEYPTGGGGKLPVELHWNFG